MLMLIKYRGNVKEKLNCQFFIVYMSLNSSAFFFPHSPAELQFYPNMAAVMLQVPMWFFLVDFAKLQAKLNKNLICAIFLDGVSFHGQTITAYVLMTYVSPVTYR